MKMIIGALVATLLSSTAANAAVYTFAITGDYNATFQLKSNPIPTKSFSSQFFEISNSAISSTVSGVANFQFYNIATGGGLAIVDFRGKSGTFNGEGAQLYTGTEAAPMFRLGKFVLTEFRGTRTYTLDISGGTIPAVPEPATWAMMLVGFGMMGATLRYRRRTTAVTYA
jgi:hypothetical protein